jgi:uncharacterized protein (DUF433 family)
VNDHALLDRIEVNPKVLVGKPVIRGTRISVELIFELLAGGWSFDDIRQNYPQVTLEDIRACFAYAQRMVEDEEVYLLDA